MTVTLNVNLACIVTYFSFQLLQRDARRDVYHGMLVVEALIHHIVVFCNIKCKMSTKDQSVTGI